MQEEIAKMCGEGWPINYVIAATDVGPMIVNRMDFGRDKDGTFHSVGTEVLEFGCHGLVEIRQILDVILLCRKHHGDGVVVIDGGANMGTHTVAWARQMRGWGAVIAMEPQERVFYALAGNIAINNLFNAQAMCVAIGQTHGAKRKMQTSSNIRSPFPTGGVSLIGTAEDTPGLKTELVDVIAIDALNLPRLDVLKLDIEGMEIEAIRGAGETIIRCKPVVIVEHVKVGSEAIRAELGPWYKTYPMYEHLCCFHRDDQILNKVEIREVA